MSTFTRVGPEEAHRTLEDKGVGQLVDVREGSEVDALRVEGALNLPLSRLDALIDRIDRSRPVFLLCRSGGRAAKPDTVPAPKLTRIGHTCATATHSDAPAEVFTAAGESPTLSCSGSTTRSTAKPSATRRIAPRFCGSVIPSRMRTNEVVSRAITSSKSA